MITLHHVVGAAILREGCILAAQRGPKMSQSGVWEFPGGKVEAGESESAALVRELHEELNLRLQPLRRLGEVIRSQRGLRLVVWHCTAEGSPELREHSAVRWVPLSELFTMGWSEPDLPFLPLIQALLEPA